MSQIQTNSKYPTLLPKAKLGKEAVMDVTLDPSKSLRQVQEQSLKRKRESETLQLLQKEGVKRRKQERQEQRLQLYLQNSVRKAERKREREEEIRALYEKREIARAQQEEEKSRNREARRRELKRQKEVEQARRQEEKSQNREARRRELKRQKEVEKARRQEEKSRDREARRREQERQKEAGRARRQEESRRIREPRRREQERQKEAGRARRQEENHRIREARKAARVRHEARKAARVHHENTQQEQSEDRLLAIRKLRSALEFLNKDFASKEKQSAENDWCKPVSDTIKASAITSFWKETQREEALPIFYCVICQLKYSRSMLTLESWRHLIPAELAQILYSRTRCDVCFPTDNDDRVLCCKSCVASLRQGKVPRECQVNQLSIPCHHLYPAELSCLTPVEEKLIAIGISYCLVTKFHIDTKSRKPTNVSYRKLVKGHVTVFANDVVGVSRILPPSIDDVAEQIRVIWVGPDTPKPKDISMLMSVSRRRVCQALLWLKENNPLYKDIEINLEEMRRWGDAEDWVPPQLLANICHVSDSELEQGERSSYIPPCDTTIDSEDREDEDGEDEHENLMEIEEAQLTSGGNVEEVNKMLITSSGFTNLPTLTGPDNADCLMQIHNRVRQSLHETHGSELDNLDCTTYKIRSIEDQGSYISVCRGSKFLDWYKDDDFFPACFPALFPYGSGGPRVSDGGTGDDKQQNFGLKTWAGMLLQRHGGRFATHPIFPFLVFNTEARSTNAQVAAARVSSSRYSKVCEAVEQLNEASLKEAEEEIRLHRKTKNPHVNCLLKEVSIMGQRHPFSNEAKMNARHKCKALMLRDCVANVWFTLNPNDLTNPACIKLAVYREKDMTAAKEILNGLRSHLRSVTRSRLVNRDPVSAALFFKSQMDAFFKHLVRTNETGCFGRISNYFGTVESNGRGMLHLHGLLWFHANLRLPQLLDDIKEDKEGENEEYKRQVLAFIDDIFSENISDPSLAKQTTRNKSRSLHIPNPSMQESVEQCANELQQDSDFVAANTQRHTCGAVCVKYGDAKKRKQDTGTTCRFGCPWRCHDTTHVDERTGNINLYRRDPRINRFNRSIATALRYNHDFTFIATKTRMLSTVYYISNYATKFETPIYQRVALMSMIADDEAKKRTGQMSNSRTTKTFMQRVFNKICTERELSAVEVCAYLLDHNFDYSSVSSNGWVWVHPGTLYWCMVRHWRLLRQAVKSEDEAGDEVDQVRLTATGARPTVFSAYLSRGADLKSLCFYDYISLIKIERKSGNHRSYSACFDFVDVPQLQIFTQRVRSTEDIAVPVFSTTLARTEDMAPKFWKEVINLALFVPWEQFFGITTGSISDTWHQSQGTLPGRLQMYSVNLELLYKSAKDAKLDAMLWHSRTECDDMDELPLEADDVMLLEQSTTAVQLHETMQLFQDSVAQMFDQVRDINPNASLYEFVYHRHPTRSYDADSGSHSLSELHQRLDLYLQDMSDDIRPEGGISDLISDWKRKLEQDDKTIKKSILGIGQECNAKSTDAITQEPSSGGQIDLNAFDIHEDGCMLHSTPVQGQPRETTVTKVQADIRSHLEIAKEIADEQGLNKKQCLFLFGCASHLDSVQSEDILPANSESASHSPQPVAEAVKQSNQLRLYFGGEGGTGKSVCIRCLLKIIERKQKRSAIIVTATSGTAAFNIDGITIHSALGLNTRDSRFQISQVKGEHVVCWQAKEVLVIDECSMLSAQMLLQVDRRLRALRRCDDLPFGGMPLVLLTGDFMQFAPIGGSSLLNNPTEKRKRQQEDGKLPMSLSQPERDHHTGHELFQLFDNVIILTEQMRQSADPEFGNILRRLREHRQTAEDLQRMNSRVTSYHNIDFCGGTKMITKTNVMRHTVNLDVAFQYATFKCQPLHIFLSNHWVNAPYRANRLENSTRMPTKQELLDAFETMDNTENHVPAYFPFIPGMPVMVTKNIFQSLGVANGSVFTAVDVLPDPLSERIELETGVVIHSRPPICLLITSASCESAQLPGLDRGIIPLLPISEPVSRQGRASFTWRTGLPCTPAFAITDYKSQSQTFDKMCGDINSRSSFSNLYVDLSRGKTLEGMFLLRPIPEAVWNREPPSNIKAGMLRLDELSKKTLERWNHHLM